MRRRICIVGVALGASALVFGAVAAVAAVAAGGKPVTKVTCTSHVGIVVATGDSTVTPPVKQGNEYGTVACGKRLGSGVQADGFTVPDSGDTLAHYQMYFPTGTIHGKYDLTPQEGSFGGSSFSEADYVGKLTVTGGTGSFQGAKGTGTMVCKTLDGIHTRCTDKLKLTNI